MQETGSLHSQESGLALDKCHKDAKAVPLDQMSRIRSGHSLLNSWESLT